MKQFLSFVLVCLLFACENTDIGQYTEDFDDLMNNLDSVQIDYDTVIVKDSKSLSQFPYFIDSTNFSFLIKKKESELNPSFLMDALTVFQGDEYQDYYIKQYLFIDSLKQIDEYEHYAWDIGNIMYAEAYPLDTLILSNNEKIIFWYLKESTYEACPSASYDMIYSTMYKEDNPSITFLFAERSGGGEGGFWGETNIYSYMDTAFNVKQIRVDINGEEDDEGNEIIESRLDSTFYSIKDYQIVKAAP